MTIRSQSKSSCCKVVRPVRYAQVHSVVRLARTLQAAENATRAGQRSQREPSTSVVKRVRTFGEMSAASSPNAALAGAFPGHRRFSLVPESFAHKPDAQVVSQELSSSLAAGGSAATPTRGHNPSVEPTPNRVALWPGVGYRVHSPTPGQSTTLPGSPHLKR
jgi:hypothetical protein